MYFLGLAGMPRRIPDYPQMYAGWNFIASVGSNISVIAIFYFIFMIYICFFSDATKEEIDQSN
jgi:cytochrome c oxidase subunit 1